MVVFGGEPQAGGQAYPVGEQDLGRSRVDALVLGGEVTDAGINDLHELGTGWRLQVLGVEDLPLGVIDLGLHPGRDLGQQVPAPMQL